MTHKPNVGDIVHMRGRVIEIGTDPFLRRVDFDTEAGRRLWVTCCAIVHVEPRPLAVGDRLWPRGVIKAIDGEWAWVKYDDCHATESIHKIRRHQP